MYCFTHKSRLTTTFSKLGAPWICGAQEMASLPRLGIGIAAHFDFDMTYLTCASMFLVECVN